MDLYSQWDYNFDQLQQSDKEAKNKGKLTGRYIKENYADGYAFYKINRTNKNTVSVSVVTDIGDDWVIPYWGKKAKINRKYAEANIKMRDSLEELFNNKK